jgi:hypothetical protein
MARPAAIGVHEEIILSGSTATAASHLLRRSCAKADDRARRTLISGDRPAPLHSGIYFAYFLIPNSYF